MLAGVGAAVTPSIQAILGTGMCAMSCLLIYRVTVKWLSLRLAPALVWTKHSLLARDFSVVLLCPNSSIDMSQVSERVHEICRRYTG